MGKRKNRPRNKLWFNPPYSADIETNVAKTFLKLIDKHFPKSHLLHKVFNRNNVKVSYSCTSNMRNLIKQHNAKILNETRKANSDGCNCRKRNSCPLDGACLASGIVYKATVTTNIGQPKIYIGSTEHSFHHGWHWNFTPPPPHHAFRNSKMLHPPTHSEFQTPLPPSLWEFQRCFRPFQNFLFNLLTPQKYFFRPLKKMQCILNLSS